MVVLFSDRKNVYEKEIIEILLNYGAAYISDKTINCGIGKFTIISEYKVAAININSGIAVFLDDSERFEKQKLPVGIVGICEDSNKKALQIFRNGNISVISCGMNLKNTVTLSSLNDNSVLLSLQRTITDMNGTDIEPSEFKIKLTKSYSSFAIMASAIILIIMGIYPEYF